MPVIYLNNAATSWPKPQRVKEVLAESLEHPVFGSGRTTGTQGIDYISLAREKAAGLFHADAKQIVFTHSATDSLNIIISGFLKKNRGCHAVATALDHNSVLRPLHEFQRDGILRFDIADFAEGYVSPDTISSLIRKDTKFAVMTHASNVLGSVQDVRAVADILADKDIFFIVDGAQTAGHIAVDVEKIGCDAFVFTGHKALLGVAGTGGFYLKDAEQIAPTRFGGTGTQSSELFQPEDMPEKFECGTQNVTGLAALAEGISYVKSRGVADIHAQGMRQTKYLVSRFREAENIRIHHETPEVPVLSFNIEGLSCEDVGFILSRKYGIVTRTGLHCAPLVHEKIDGGAGSVRISLSCFTTDAECTAAADAVLEIAENAAKRFNSA